MIHWRAFLQKCFFKRSASHFIRPPPDPAWLMEHRNERQGERALTRAPNSLASLYRMYEYLVVDFTQGLRTEIEFFFNHPTWSVKDIADPHDADPVRYAILAVLPHYLAQAFNRLIKKGLPRGSPAILTPEIEAFLKSQPVKLEEAPSWAADVPPLQDVFIIPGKDGLLPSAQSRSKRFYDMNILVDEPHVLFV
ncbi:hypothetical protein E4U41_002679 [Claviceps citrina]|nr:hypothetical protein E4U41_002679 [Claviceps citrina]